MIEFESYFSEFDGDAKVLWFTLARREALRFCFFCFSALCPSLAFGAAMFAAASEIEGSVVGFKSLREHGQFAEFLFVDGNVKDLSAVFAKEMCVVWGFIVKADVSFVKGQLFCRSLLGEEFEGVIDGCFGKRRHADVQGGVDFLCCGVSSVCHQIAHDCHSLHGGLNAVVGEIGDSVGRLRTHVVSITIVFVKQKYLFLTV